jgi:hypothetical protein
MSDIALSMLDLTGWLVYEIHRSCWDDSQDHVTEPE